MWHLTIGGRNHTASWYCSCLICCCSVSNCWFCCSLLEGEAELYESCDRLFRASFSFPTSRDRSSIWGGSNMKTWLMKFKDSHKCHVLEWRVFYTDPLVFLSLWGHVVLHQLFELTHGVLGLGQPGRQRLVLLLPRHHQLLQGFTLCAIVPRLMEEQRLFRNVQYFRGFVLPLLFLLTFCQASAASRANSSCFLRAPWRSCVRWLTSPSSFSRTVSWSRRDTESSGAISFSAVSLLIKVAPEKHDDTRKQLELEYIYFLSRQKNNIWIFITHWRVN